MARDYLKKAIGADQKQILDSQVRASVQAMISAVQRRGDAAVRELSEKFDCYSPASFLLTERQIEEMTAEVAPEDLRAIRFALEQVRTFAKAQRQSVSDIEVETLPGVVLGHRTIPVKNVGCYIPGGRYPMVASAIMSIATARAAGVTRIVACTPPKDGRPYAATVATMKMAGADEIYVLGGVQAIAAMALGTETMRPVDMLVGPGNAYIAEAKRQLFGQVGIDLLAGPTEILVIADATADVEMVATDLLGQAEHGVNSPAVLITTSRALAEALPAEIDRQLGSLSTGAIARQAWRDYGEIILTDTDEEMVQLGDEVAAEHVEILTRDPDFFLRNLSNYGSLFLGPETNVAYGDKAIGTNHILPTGKAARYTGGLWVGKFLKTVTYQKCTPQASVIVGENCSRVCQIEGFAAHREQAELRLRRYRKAK